MAFQFEDSMIDQYVTQGYVVFEQILPATLVRDLRVQADRARELAYEVNGPQTQRIQPVGRYADKIDIKPFEDYCQLPALVDAVHRLLSPQHQHGHLNLMGILLEPQDFPWTCGWHRDGPVEVPEPAYDDILQAVIAEAWYDTRHFNQVNCALYPDSCTWYVPGSHLRQWNRPGERQTHGPLDPSPRVAKLSKAEAEMELHEHGRSFPGAVQMHLNAGDYMIYRNHAWHNGIYNPNQPRATIHDSVTHDQAGDWGARWGQAKRAAVERLEQRQLAEAEA